MNYVQRWVSLFFVLFIPHLDNASKVVVWKVLVSTRVTAWVLRREINSHQSRLVGSGCFKVSCLFQVWLWTFWSRIHRITTHHGHQVTDFKGVSWQVAICHTCWCSCQRKKSLGQLPLCCASLCLRLKAQPFHPCQQQAQLLKSIMVSHNGSLYLDVTKLAKSIESGSVRCRGRQRSHCKSHKCQWEVS